MGELHHVWVVELAMNNCLGGALVGGISLQGDMMERYSIPFACLFALSRRHIVAALHGVFLQSRRLRRSPVLEIVSSYIAALCSSPAIPSTPTGPPTVFCSVDIVLTPDSMVLHPSPWCKLSELIWERKGFGSNLKSKKSKHIVTGVTITWPTFSGSAN